MVTAYQPWFTPISFDGIDSDTPAGLLPALLSEHEELGGYTPCTGQLTPFKNVNKDMEAGLTKEMLDSLTAAVEAGLGVPEMFIADFFTTADDALAFVYALEVYAETVWVNDRHFYAFIHATGATVKNAVTYYHMADHLRDLIEVERRVVQIFSKVPATVVTGH